MPALPYNVVFIDHGLSETVFTNYLNTQWKEGWDYVAHLTCVGPKQALLMKKRDYPEMHKVLAALMSLWGDGTITRDELFAKFTALLSDDPTELAAVRATLKDKPGAGAQFEEWLRDLRKKRPAIMMSSGTRIEISDELLEVLIEDAKKRA